MTTTSEAIDRARAAMDRGDFESAIALLRPLADSGEPEAQYWLGYLALTECDLISGREAFSLFRAAAERDHPEAIYHLATFPHFVSEPFESPLTGEETWRCLLQAAHAGSVEAQYSAGASLATGEWNDGHVIPQDLETAVTMYRRAAEAGHPRAQFNLATMILNGEGCDRDVEEAKRWLRAAAAQGEIYAQQFLDDLEDRDRE